MIFHICGARRPTLRISVDVYHARVDGRASPVHMELT